MENPLRTAQYLAHVETRRASLRRWSADRLSAGPPVTLEIGCGHGHFLTNYAKLDPAQKFVGLDIIAERIVRAVRKVKRAKLENLHFIQASAEDFLATLPPEVSFSRIFLLFPDPWPKRRHHKNRVMQNAFLDLLAAVCTPKARLYFRTDDQAYFKAAKELILGHSRWQIIEDDWPFESTTVFQQRAPSFQSLTVELLPLLENKA